jgi:hypothetical protein
MSWQARAGDEKKLLDVTGPFGFLFPKAMLLVGLVSNC